MNRLACLRLPLAAFAALTLSACEPLDLGQPLDAGGGVCVATPTLLADADAKSTLGFSARELLERVEGEHQSPMIWAAPSDDGPAYVEFSTTPGAAQLTTTVRYEGGEVREVRSEPEQSGFTLGGERSCPDYVEVDVEVDVFTDDGALAETVPATVRSWDPRFGQIELSLPIDELAGSLSVVALEPANAQLAPFSLRLGISALGLSGGLESGVELSEGNAVGFGAVPVAAWPTDENPCDPSEAAASFEGAFGSFAATDVLARVNAVAEARLRWQGGPASALTLGALHQGDPVCFTAIPEDDGLDVGQLRTRAKLSVSASDDTMNGNFDVDVYAEPADDGSLGDVRVDIYAPYASTVALSQFVELYGITGVDLEGYDEAGLTFSGVFLADGQASGALTVLGVIKHDCSDNEPGQGCEGNEVVELAMAEWGTAIPGY